MSFLWTAVHDMNRKETENSLYYILRAVFKKVFGMIDHGRAFLIGNDIRCPFFLMRFVFLPYAVPKVCSCIIGTLTSCEYAKGR